MFVDVKTLPRHSSHSLTSLAKILKTAPKSRAPLALPWRAIARRKHNRG